MKFQICLNRYQFQTVITVHKDVTLKNGKKIGQAIPESIEIKGVFLSERNPIVKLGLVIR